jgi:cytochrome c-type biogenesis protein CcmH
MSSFLIVASLLATVACAFIVLPLVLKRRGLPAAPWAALVAVALVAGGSAVLYATWSTWSFKPSASDGSPQGMVGQLVRRLDSHPDDLAGWLMLGRSYAQLEQYPMAARAYQRADRLADGKNAEALTGLAEALILGKQGDLDGRPGRLFEQALALDPRSTKALFYSAIAAMERGEKPLARSRFTQLLSADPPPEVRQLIERTLASLDDAAAPAVAAAGAQAAPPTPASAGEVAEVHITVTLSPKVAASAAAGAPLFVLARNPGQRGPPLAARRLEATFPQAVVLKSTDAMISGTGFTKGQALEITARVANGGSAMAKSGDPFGSAQVTVGSGGTLAIVIDQLTP